VNAAAIVNPRAGGGAARRRWPEVAAELARRLGCLQTFFTEGPGHATALARRLAADGFDPLIAAGGDGTLNEVVNGVLPDAPATRIAVMPLASGGDFARALGLRGTAHAVEILAAGAARPVDVVRIRFRGPSGTGIPACVGFPLAKPLECERRFVNVASFGLGGAVMRDMRGWHRLLPPGARYLAGALVELARGRAYTIRLSIDGGEPEEMRITIAALANGRYEGAGILIAPRAKIADGLLDITMVRHVSLADVAAHIRLLYSGAIYSHPKVRHYRARRVLVESDSAVPLELDGEFAGTLPLEAGIEPGALRLICPGVDSPERVVPQ
jgi:YegS/Rv2252/BmrU family lipid kinase